MQSAILIFSIVYLCLADHDDQSGTSRQCSRLSSCEKCLKNENCGWTLDQSGRGGCKGLIEQTCPPTLQWYINACPCYTCRIPYLALECLAEPYDVTGELVEGDDEGEGNDDDDDYQGDDDDDDFQGDDDDDDYQGDDDDNRGDDEGEGDDDDHQGDDDDYQGDYDPSYTTGYRCTVNALGKCVGTLDQCCCVEDGDCPTSTHFCLYSYLGPSTSGFCTPYSQVGEICGGFTLPGFQRQCDPSLECVYSPLVADLPGNCQVPVK